MYLVPGWSLSVINAPYGAYLDHGYASNANTLFTRICRFENWCKLLKSFCDKNLAIQKVFVFSDSAVGNLIFLSFMKTLTATKYLQKSNPLFWFWNTDICIGRGSIENVLLSWKNPATKMRNAIANMIGPISEWAKPENASFQGMEGIHHRW